MVEETSRFPLVRKGYDRAQVDEHIHELESALEESESALEETRSQVTELDSRILRLSGELKDLPKGIYIVNGKKVVKP